MKKKDKLPILLEQDLILFNYIYELYLNEVNIINYKKHIIQNPFESFVVGCLEKEDYILGTSLYYLNHIIIKDHIITNSTLNFVATKNKDILAEIYSDVLNILPLCSQIYLLLERKNDKDLIEKMYTIYKMCRNMYTVGQKLCELYIKEGDFLKEIQNGYIEIVRRQVRSEIEKQLIAIYGELKELKKYLIDKKLDLFDIIQDLKNKLFDKFFTNEDKNKTSLVKLSKKPFIYWKENRTNILSVINLYFLDKYYDGFGKEIDELKKIENVSTSLIFFFEYEEIFWKKKSYNSIALKFFMDNNDMMKYSYITKNEDDLKEFLKKYYNYTSLDSFSFKKSVKTLISDLSKENSDILLLFKDISRKLPQLISDYNFIVPSADKEDLVNNIGIKAYEIFAEALDEK